MLDGSLQILKSLPRRDIIDKQRPLQFFGSGSQILILFELFMIARRRFSAAGFRRSRRGLKGMPRSQRVVVARR